MASSVAVNVTGADANFSASVNKQCETTIEGLDEENDPKTKESGEFIIMSANEIGAELMTVISASGEEESKWKATSGSDNNLEDTAKSKPLAYVETSLDDLSYDSSSLSPSPSLSTLPDVGGGGNTNSNNDNDNNHKGKADDTNASLALKREKQMEVSEKKGESLMLVLKVFSFFEWKNSPLIC